MIQTKVFITSFKGLNFDIVPKQIKRPSGIEKRSVKKKSPQVTLKPSRSVKVTFQKLINLSLKIICYPNNSTAHFIRRVRCCGCDFYVIVITW